MHLERDVALLVALLDALDEWRGDVVLEGIEVVWGDLLWEAKSSKDNVFTGVLEKSVGCGDRTRVFVAESSCEDISLCRRIVCGRGILPRAVTGWHSWLSCQCIDPSGKTKDWN